MSGGVAGMMGGVASVVVGVAGVLGIVGVRGVPGTEGVALGSDRSTASSGLVLKSGDAIRSSSGRLIIVSMAAAVSSGPIVVLPFVLAEVPPNIGPVASVARPELGSLVVKLSRFAPRKLLPDTDDFSEAVDP